MYINFFSALKVYPIKNGVLCNFRQLQKCQFKKIVTFHLRVEVGYTIKQNGFPISWAVTWTWVHGVHLKFIHSSKCKKLKSLSFMYLLVLSMPGVRHAWLVHLIKNAT